MYQSFIIVILLSIVSGVFATTPAPLQSVAHCRETNPDVNTTRTFTRHCFKSVVRTYLNLPNSDPVCSNVTSMETSLQNHITTVKNKCQPLLITNETMILKLVEFSFHDDTFKAVYGDARCVEEQKPAITKCINDTVGHKALPANKTHRHSPWILKTQLYYKEWNCDLSDELKICVGEALKVCKPTTRKFVESLFDISRRYCLNITTTKATIIDPPKPKPIAAILGATAGVVIVILITIVIVLKIKSHRYPVNE